MDVEGGIRYELISEHVSKRLGGSVKDRAALFLVQDAERKGLLKPGGTVVEGTAGNTGIGLGKENCTIYFILSFFLTTSLPTIV